jgi:dTDP-glucose 4,6-dehydratase
MNKKLLIIGGVGFISTAAIRHIMNNTKHSVVNVDKITYAASLGSLAPIENNDRNVFEQTSKETRFSNQL